MPELLPLLRDRRSIRAYDETHVLADDELAVLLEAARWSPSAGNSQPWAFLVGRRGDAAHRRVRRRCSRRRVRRWAPAASALVFTLNQVASGPEDDALGYSDYAAVRPRPGGRPPDASRPPRSGSASTSSRRSTTTAWPRLAGVPAHWRVTTGLAVGLRRRVRPRPAHPPTARRPRLRRRGSGSRCRSAAVHLPAQGRDGVQPALAGRRCPPARAARSSPSACARCRQASSARSSAACSAAR